MAKRRATSKDIADLARVFRTTVSFVLYNVPGMHISQKTRQRVQRAAPRLNYHPDVIARRMVSGLTQVIGFVLCQSVDQAFADFFFPRS
jgi:LacI family transcriptional regulator